MKITSDLGRKLGQQQRDAMQPVQDKRTDKSFNKSLEAARNPQVRPSAVNDASIKSAEGVQHRKVRNASEALLARQRVAPNRFTNDILRNGNTALAQERLLGQAHAKGASQAVDAAAVTQTSFKNVKK